MSHAVIEVLRRWQAAAEAASAAVATERAARMALVTALNSAPREGVQSFTVDGENVKVTYRVNRAVDEKALEALDGRSDLKELAAQRALFRARLELSVSAWKALTAEQQTQFAPAVRESYGLPSIEVKGSK